MPLLAPATTGARARTLIEAAVVAALAIGAPGDLAAAVLALGRRGLENQSTFRAAS